MKIQNHANVLAFDPTSSVKNLKNIGNIDNKENAREVAEQFEALFLQMVLKSMREAISKDDGNSSDQTDTYMSLFDQQLAFNMSKANGGIGLANQIESQILKYMQNQNNLTSPANPEGILINKESNPISLEKNLKPIELENKTFRLEENQNKPVIKKSESELSQQLNSIVAEAKKTKTEPANLTGLYNNPNKFIKDIKQEAIKASQKLGVPPEYILGHASLESGWGKFIPKNADGTSSYNIFSIKASKDWKGKTTDITTTEFINGKPTKQIEKFKSYSSFEEAFNDYVDLLQNKRYSSVIESNSSKDFSKNLQLSGYATDPKYAVKLEEIINSNRLQKL